MSKGRRYRSGRRAHTGPTAYDTWIGPDPDGDPFPLGSRRELRAIVELLVYAALAVVATWPLAAHLTERIPLGTEAVATVPLFNLWTQWWNADRLLHAYQAYWDAPIFHPLNGAFGFSEPQPLTGLVTAVVAGVSGSYVAAYNVFLLLALTLNGWATCRLLSAVGSVWPVAVAGGVMVEHLPFVHQEFGVLQLVPLFGVIGTLLALVRLVERPDVRRGILLGLAFAATTLMCGYYGLALGVLLLVGGGVLLAGARTRWAVWQALAAALGVVAVMILPVALQQLRIAETHDLHRLTSTVARFSASAAHYRVTPWPQLLPTPGIETASSAGARAFWPGTVTICLALVGLVSGTRTRSRRWTAFCLITLTAAFMLSLGPGADGSLTLHSFFVRFYPGYEQLRSPFRFAVFVQLMVALLAAGGLGAIWRRLSFPALGRAGLVVGLGLVAALELRPGEQRLLAVPSVDARLPWLAWVETETRADDALAFLPFPVGRDASDYLETTQWMYWQMRHRRPMVNGYSGFFPMPFRELKAALENFPDATSLDLLARRGTRYCLVLRDAYPRTTVEALATSTHRLDWVFGDDVAGIDVYAVRQIRRPGEPQP